MRKLWTGLILTVGLISLVGCKSTQSTGREIPVREAVLAEIEFETFVTNLREAKEKQGEEESTDEVLAIDTEEVISTDWPANHVPAELPEYLEGSIVNSGGTENDFYILIETGEEALQKYLDDLVQGGWSLYRGDASEGFEVIKGRYSVSTQWNDRDSGLLQMSIYTSAAGVWPSDLVPPDFIEPQVGTLVGEITVQGLDEGMGYFAFTCDGMNEEVAHQYMQQYMDNGWSGDTSFVSKDLEWQGKSYSANIEIYEILGEQVSFTCNFSVNEE